MNRRSRSYFKKTFIIDESTRYDLKVIDYGGPERFILKKYIKLESGKWSGSIGTKLTLDTLADEEILPLLDFMTKNIMDMRKEQKEKDNNGNN